MPQPLQNHLAITLPAGDRKGTQEFLIYAINYWGGDPAMASGPERAERPQELSGLDSMEQLTLLARLRDWILGGAPTQDAGWAAGEAEALRWLLDKCIVTVDTWEEMTTEEERAEKEPSHLLRAAAQEHHLRNIPEEDFIEGAEGWFKVLGELSEEMTTGAGLHHLPQVTVHDAIFAAMSLGCLWAVLGDLGDYKAAQLDPKCEMPLRRHLTKLNKHELKWIDGFFQNINAPEPSFSVLHKALATPADGA